jgi:hypothetical protein
VLTEKRQDKGDTPYNLRNCAYMEDFYKQKLVYPETTQGAYFALDDKQMFIDKTCFMLISKDSIYLQRILSSKLYEYAYKNIFSSVELGEKGYQYNKHALLELPIVNNAEEIKNIEVINDEKEINNKIYQLYNITPEEIDFIEIINK